MADVTALEPDPRAREHCVLGLDVGGLDDALAVADVLAPWCGWMKVGMELAAEAGPIAYQVLMERGSDVFADTKFHDIPNTVHRASRVIGRHGVRMMNVHAAGGVEMVRAGLEGFREGRAEVGLDEGVFIAVTVLTSDPDASALESRLDVAAEAGCDGVVCAAAEAPAARARGLAPLVPGVRFADGDHHDQVRVTTPEGALDAGAQWLVLARILTAAPDPVAAAAAVHQAFRTHGRPPSHPL